MHFTTVQRRDAAFTTGAGVDYPEEVTIIPKKSSDAHLGLKSIEELRLKAGRQVRLAWSVEFCSSTVGVSHGHICCFYYLLFSVIRSVNTQPVQLIHEIQFDSPGGLRIYILMGDVKKELR